AMISGYRSHTQAIAKGIQAYEVISELFGKASGCSKGKGGSMHMFSKEHRFLGGHGIVGGQAPLGVGAAFALKYQETDANVICFLGDAAMNQGQVFEAMNMAATWKLPILFYIENNQYGMGTDIQRTTSVDHLYKRALGFDMAWEQVDGMDVLAVYESTTRIMKKMRQNREPVLVEALTYRYKGHSVSDPATYRGKEEVDMFKKRDPIESLATILLDSKAASQEQLSDINKEIKEELKNMESLADQAPFPAAETVWDHVYAE
ncbi:MAG: thiamine pyrophosphate-dependent enzyme, partial [Zetaproteobacteria bacterium]|nr:thiamine pyrophosphate-dependent enzyme [Zetaproteobacteria bacterium]